MSEIILNSMRRGTFDKEVSDSTFFARALHASLKSDLSMKQLFVLLLALALFNLFGISQSTAVSDPSSSLVLLSNYSV
jgi:hypothetical protein